MQEEKERNFGIALQNNSKECGNVTQELQQNILHSACNLLA